MRKIENHSCEETQPGSHVYLSGNTERPRTFDIFLAPSALLMGLCLFLPSTTGGEKTDGLWSSGAAWHWTVSGSQGRVPRDAPRAGAGVPGSSRQLTCRSGTLRLKALRQPPSLVGGSALTLHFPPGPYLPKHTAGASRSAPARGTQNKQEPPSAAPP